MAIMIVKHEQFFDSDLFSIYLQFKFHTQLVELSMKKVFLESGPD